MLKLRTPILNSRGQQLLRSACALQQLPNSFVRALADYVAQIQWYQGQEARVALGVPETPLSRTAVQRFDH